MGSHCALHVLHVLHVEHVLAALLTTLLLVCLSVNQSLASTIRVAADPHASALALAREIVTRSPDCVSATKQLFHKTWYSSEKEALELETKLQKKLLMSINQVKREGRVKREQLIHLRYVSCVVDLLLLLRRVLLLFFSNLVGFCLLSVVRCWSSCGRATSFRQPQRSGISLLSGDGHMLLSMSAS